MASRAIAAGCLILALVGVAWGWRAADRVSRSLSVPPGRPLTLVADGRPTLILAGDESCHACRRAFEDLHRTGEFALELEAGGVRVEVHRRSFRVEVSTWYRELENGLLPAYVVLDAEGTPLAIRRGYLSPDNLQDWVLSVLLGPHTFP